MSVVSETTTPKPVDVLLLHERQKEVEAALLIVKGMGKWGLSVDACHREVLVWSWRFFSIDAIEDGIKVLAQLPERYVREALPQQMALDSELRDLATRIVDKLIEAGTHVPFSMISFPLFGRAYPLQG